jgi:hypothetical protein
MEIIVTLVSQADPLLTKSNLFVGERFHLALGATLQQGDPIPDYDYFSSAVADGSGITKADILKRVMEKVHKWKSDLKEGDKIKIADMEKLLGSWVALFGKPKWTTYEGRLLADLIDMNPLSIFFPTTFYVTPKDYMEQLYKSMEEAAAAVGVESPKKDYITREGFKAFTGRKPV